MRLKFCTAFCEDDEEGPTIWGMWGTHYMDEKARQPLLLFIFPFLCIMMKYLLIEEEWRGFSVSICDWVCWMKRWTVNHFWWGLISYSRLLLNDRPAISDYLFTSLGLAYYMCSLYSLFMSIWKCFASVSYFWYKFERFMRGGKVFNNTIYTIYCVRFFSSPTAIYIPVD